MSASDMNSTIENNRFSKEELLHCRHCQSLFGFEPRPIVFGNSNAKIMQIGQAPSKLVHESGIPFDDLSGETLIEDWYQIKKEDFYNPDFFYLTSMAHCYPGKAKKGGDCLPPRCCSQMWLQKELNDVNNEIYLIVGRLAAMYFFQEQSFTELIFNNQHIKGKPAFVLPHPSPLNFRWHNKHPDFLKNRIQEIREAIHQTIK